MRAKNEHAVALGQLGGRARAGKTTSEQRRSWARLVNGVYTPSAVWKGALVLLPTIVLTYVYFLNRSARPLPAMMLPSSSTTEEEYPVEVSY